MSTVQGSSNIITQGLIMYLNAADSKSYVSGSTTWTDITGNGNSGAITNGPTFSGANGGSIVFDGIDDRVSRTSSIDTGQNFTVSAWIFPTLLGITRRCIAANSMNYSGRNGWLFSTAGGGTNNSLFFSIGADFAGIQAPANILNTNEWAYVTVTCQNGGVLSLYKNGQVINGSTYGTAGTTTYTYPQFNVGFRDVGSANTDPYTGRIAQTTIYNRALSATEILQNYDATKARFIR